MIMMTPCPECGGDGEPQDLEGWAPFDTVPVICVKCHDVFWLSVTNEKYTLNVHKRLDNKLIVVVENQVMENLPDLPVGSLVQIDNAGHSLHGCVGFVISKRHMHYRVKLTYNEKTVVITIPEHWIKICRTN